MLRTPGKIVICLLLFTLGGIAQQVVDAERYFRFLKEVYNRHEQGERDFLLDELNQFLQAFPEDPRARAVQYMQAKTYEEDGGEHLALAAYLKMLCVYPDSANQRQGREAVQELVNTHKSFAAKRDWLNNVINHPPVIHSRADGYFQYLGILREADYKQLDEWYIDACNEYLRSFSEAARSEEVLQWLADLHRNRGDYREARLTYRKMELLFPESSLIPYYLYSQGELLYRHLDDPDGAIAELQRLVQEFPQSSRAPEGRFLIAEIREDQKLYPEAIEGYRQVTGGETPEELAVQAQWRIAEIQRRRLKDYRTAVESYAAIVEKFPAHRQSYMALEEMADVFREELHEFRLAAEALAKIAEMHPDYEKAPEQLYRAAEIYEKDLNVYAKAVEVYEAVIQQYPGHKRARAAAKRINKLRKKIDLEHSTP